MTLVGMLNDRLSLYSMGVYDRMKAFDAISHSIANSTHYNFNSAITYNLVEALKGFEFVIVICNSLCDIILFFFIFICFIMTYNLVHNDIDERTFDFGMLRTVGYTKTHIILILIFQTLSYSVSAFFCCIITSYSLNSILTLIFTRIIHYPEYHKLDGFTILVVAILAIVFPIFTNIISMNRVMSKYIRDSIDLLHNSITDVKITFAKLESIGMSFTSISIAISLIVCGGIAFYIVPFSILVKNYEMFMFSMQIILFFMLIGVILILSPFIHLFQIALGYLFLLFSCELKLCKVLKKNFESHKSRNVTTTIILTIITAFAIFSTASFHSQTSLISESLCQFAGSEIRAYSFGGNGTDSFDEVELRKYLDSQKSKGSIDEYSFISNDISHILTNTYSPAISLTNKAKTELINIPIYAVEQDYLNSTYDLLDVYEGALDPIQSLYNSTGNWDNCSSVYDPYNITSTQGYYFSPPILTNDCNLLHRFKWHHYSHSSCLKRCS
jgi:hypothetical protein